MGTTGVIAIAVAAGLVAGALGWWLPVTRRFSGWLGAAGERPSVRYRALPRACWPLATGAAGTLVATALLQQDTRPFSVAASYALGTGLERGVGRRTCTPGLGRPRNPRTAKPPRAPVRDSNVLFVVGELFYRDRRMALPGPGSTLWRYCFGRLRVVGTPPSARAWSRRCAHGRVGRLWCRYLLAGGLLRSSVVCPSHRRGCFNSHCQR